ncbi:diaminopimelate epimerase [Breznakibacter xylanolyticus]|uniref:Diaminopimelate epimerase n=1 Tax=Breznakibacter xylanolyticus TaxID=990 RepID=A0A2W7PTJ6_9BACT|nr:diaminopimelate epimerase [Breznakibacter xylanolyticus]PZX12769.1 diaminopimelate epimerase [Breznakibacter xylanolyticus]
MLHINFSKYQGAGNDFVVIDNRDKHFDSANVQLVSFLCDRRFGVGGDGLMLLENDPDGSAFLMRYFNSDGREASMCGNGGRCIIAFAVHLGIVNVGELFAFNAVDGLHEAVYLDENHVSLKMIDVDTIEHADDAFFMNTGSPHHVAFVDDVAKADVVGEGRSIRHSSRYAPGGTNVNFVQLLSSAAIRVRTFERGVEDETLACGTGVVASAIAASLKLGGGNEFDVKVEGGDMRVTFQHVNHRFTNVWLIGPAKFVFKGVI